MDMHIIQDSSAQSLFKLPQNGVKLRVGIELFRPGMPMGKVHTDAQSFQLSA